MRGEQLTRVDALYNPRHVGNGLKVIDEVLGVVPRGTCVHDPPATFQQHQLVECLQRRTSALEEVTRNTKVATKARPLGCHSVGLHWWTNYTRICRVECRVAFFRAKTGLQGRFTHKRHCR